MIELTSNYGNTIYVNPFKVLCILQYGYVGRQYTKIYFEGGEVFRVQDEVSEVKDRIDRAKTLQSQP